MSWRKTVPVRLPEEATTIAYLAGIIDGEGWVGIVPTSRGPKQGRGSIALSVTNTNPKLVLWLWETFGGGVGNGNRAKAHHKDFYVWRLTGENAAIVCRAIYPMLLLKREQIDVVLAFHALRRAPSLGKGWQEVPESVTATRQELQTHLKLLNRKGA